MNRTPAVLSAAALLASVTLVTPSAAAAPTRAVPVENHSFVGGTFKVKQGTTVVWSFRDPVAHTSTSNQGFWASPLRATGTFSHLFRDAGKFGYHCEPHPHMTGRITVPVRAKKRPAGGYVVRWSKGKSTPADRSFDVQVKRLGSSAWRPLRTDTKQRKARFNPAAKGTYRFRARTDNRTNGRSSGWSPARKVTIG